MNALSLQEIFEKGSVIAERYEVTEFLAERDQIGFLKAKDLMLEDEPTNIKIIIRSKETTDSDYIRFRNEVILARRLAHPRITRIFDFGQAGDGCYFITSEHEQGAPLNSILKQGPLPLTEALIYLRDIALALNFAHSKNVIHRDICPENVFIRFDKRAKLSDFGSAKSITEHMHLTRTGEIVGNLDYMSPEQLRCEQLDKRADIYAFGILAYEILSGKRPFQSENMSSIATMHISKEVPLLQNENPEIPAWIDDLIQTATKKNKEDRFSSMDEILDIIIPKVGDSGGFRIKKKNKSKINLPLRSIALTVLLATLLTGIYLNLELFLKQYGIDNTAEKAIGKEKQILTATLTGDDEEVFKLLQSGVPISTIDGRGTNLLGLASEQGHTNVIYTLLEFNPTILNQQDQNGETPLIKAAKANKIESIKLLLKYEADTTITDTSGKTAADHTTKKEILSLLRGN